MPTINLAMEGGTRDQSKPAARGLFNSKPTRIFPDNDRHVHHWAFDMPSFSTSITLYLKFFMTDAIAGNVVLSGRIMKARGGEAQSVLVDSYDIVNKSAATSVPGTAGYPVEVAITITNDDAVQPGDYVGLEVAREGGDAGDDAAGTLEIFSGRLVAV